MAALSRTTSNEPSSSVCMSIMSPTTQRIVGPQSAWRAAMRSMTVAEKSRLVSWMKPLSNISRLSVELPQPTIRIRSDGVMCLRSSASIPPNLCTHESTQPSVQKGPTNTPHCIAVQPAHPVSQS